MKTHVTPCYFGMFLCLFLGFSTPSQAQLWKKVVNHAKEKVDEKVIDDVDNATDKALDKQQQSANEIDNNTTDDSGNSSTPTITSYQNYDFVPGDTVLFADDFADDQNGEFPSHWNLTTGQAVVNTVAGKSAFLLTQGNYCNVQPRMKKQSYLTDPFTIEFDTYTDGNGDESPILFLTCMDKDGNNFDGEIAFDRGDDEGRGDVTLSNFPNSSLSSDLPDALKANYINNWHHCAIIYKNSQLKCYVDQYRILVAPNLDCTPIAFGFEGIGDEDHPVVITNVRAAAGGSMNMVGKKFTEAKIVTHGITFDIDKSDIKPQSMGTLNMVVGVLKSDPNLKFEIDGYTDNTGESAHNLTLSQQRADAVKSQLVKMGISASRLTSKGFGDAKPISDNTTPEGKANNRRVEFVRT